MTDRSLVLVGIVNNLGGLRVMVNDRPVTKCRCFLLSSTHLTLSYSLDKQGGLIVITLDGDEISGVPLPALQATLNLAAYSSLGLDVPTSMQIVLGSQLPDNVRAVGCGEGEDSTTT